MALPRWIDKAYCFGKKAVESVTYPDLSTLAEEYAFEPVRGSDIRAIKFQRTEEGHIYRDLQHYKIDAPGWRFCALSYVWGDPKVTKTIAVNRKKYKVTQDMYNGLCRLAKYGKRQGFYPFWIDAISIDQKNNAEKSRQIPRMTQIYGKATIVMAWLGNDLPVYLTILFELYPRWSRD